jgi:hypothetical protein
MWEAEELNAASLGRASGAPSDGDVARELVAGLGTLRRTRQALAAVVAGEDVRHMTALGRRGGRRSSPWLPQTRGLAPRCCQGRGRARRPCGLVIDVGDLLARSWARKGVVRARENGLEMLRRKENGGESRRPGPRWRRADELALGRLLRRGRKQSRDPPLFTQSDAEE